MADMTLTPLPAFDPSALKTVVDLLRRTAADLPEYQFCVYLVDGELEEAGITYGELDRRARAIGAWLQQHKAAGERALLLYPPGLDYIAAYFGCLYAGLIAVPAYPPRINRPVPRIQGIVADAQAKFALTTSEIHANLEQRFEHTPDLQALTWLDTQQVPGGLESAWKEPQISSRGLAFLQYTSGSTSQPKGVMVSHENLLYNLAQIQAGFRLKSDVPHAETVVSWLPSYHDMGLIGGILGSLYTRAKLVLLSPLAFLQRPIRWLQAISRHQATVSGGPNFAYDICIEKIRPEQIETLDFSSWRVAFSGAEPIRVGTLERFARTFAPCHFRPETYYPCYGLAEATLMAAGGDGPELPHVLTLRREAIELGYAEVVEPDSANSLVMVDCGRSILDQQTIIAHPENLTRCPDGMIGEIWISGINVAQGYWNRPEESQRTFNAFLVDTEEGPFLRTGDLGFLREGRLYVTGRLKDMIIIRGSNHYPQDIELTVENSHPACQVGGGAAFSITVEGTEELVVVQEVRRQARNTELDEVIQAIRTSISESHDLQAYAILLIRPLTIPKTSSGKIQRHAARTAYLEESLEVIEQWQARPPVG
jgi:acyl-CoA synthetase (AMP-forming)/AMP-acid ligase II